MNNIACKLRTAMWKINSGGMCRYTVNKTHDIYIASEIIRNTLIVCLIEGIDKRLENLTP